MNACGWVNSNHVATIQTVRAVTQITCTRQPTSVDSWDHHYTLMIDYPPRTGTVHRPTARRIAEVVRQRARSFVGHTLRRRHGHDP